MNHLLIVINGDIQDYNFHKKAVSDVTEVIVVDGGSRHIKGLGIKPDILLGDFDSIHDKKRFVHDYEGVEVIEFPPRKNYTDTELAVEYAISRTPDKVTLIGCIGNRMDHTFSTVLLLKKFLDAGIEACMVNETNEIRIMNGRLELEGNPGDLLSIVPVTERVEGINLYGLEYPLVNATLLLGSSTGISNVFRGTSARIEIQSGILLVFKSKD